jgi:hypothetical protein
LRLHTREFNRFRFAGRPLYSINVGPLEVRNDGQEKAQA